MLQNAPHIAFRLRLLLSFACLFGGLLAGENVFRYAMEVPGWRHIDITQWGEYSRHADLGTGIFIFPLEAILAFSFLLWASILVMKRKGEFRSMTVPVHSATLCALVGLGLTLLAAPVMLSVRTMRSEAELQEAFNAFHRWGLLRGIAQLLSFCACVWAMASPGMPKNGQEIP